MIRQKRNKMLLPVYIFFNTNLEDVKKIWSNQTGRSWALSGSSIPSKELWHGRYPAPAKGQMFRKSPFLSPLLEAWLTSHQHPSSSNKYHGGELGRDRQPGTSCRAMGSWGCGDIPAPHTLSVPALAPHSFPRHLRDIGGCCWDAP